MSDVKNAYDQILEFISNETEKTLLLRGIADKDRMSKPSVKVVITTSKVSTEDIRNYIKVKLETGRENGLIYCDVISGDIHREMNLDNKMPSVCEAMYKLISETDEILHTTPSGKSSTIKIRYYLNKS